MASERQPVGRLRIGELSRRVGVSAELLRAWERRYALLSPERTEGGFRLYGVEDERRIERMLTHLAAGVSTAEAAKLAQGEHDDRQEAEPSVGSTPAETRQSLRLALDRFDEAAAHAALDRLLSAFALETVLRDAVLPYLRELGERWERGEASIAQEHFASALLHGRLLGLARGWGNGHGPLALLACMPGEQHDLGLICFGLTLRGDGWRIAFLGADTPFATIGEAVAVLRPELVVLTGSIAAHAVGVESDLAGIARSVPLALAGHGMSAELALRTGARFVAADPVTAAAEFVRV